MPGILTPAFGATGAATLGFFPVIFCPGPAASSAKLTVTKLTKQTPEATNERMRITATFHDYERYRTKNRACADEGRQCQGRLGQRIKHYRGFDRLRATTIHQEEFQWRPPLPDIAKKHQY